MDDTPYHIDTTEYSTPKEQKPKYSETKQASDPGLKEETDRVKNKLLNDLREAAKDVNVEEAYDEEDPKSKIFAVSNPVKSGGHIKYTVSGVDGDGPFEESRRFREFYALRNVLVQRWPGIYIPAIPEKKLVVRITIPSHMFLIGKQR